MSTTASYDILQQLVALESPTLEDLLSIRKSVSQAHGLSSMPSNSQIIKTYFEGIQQGTITRNKSLELLLRKRAIRSQSGIVPVQVLTKPFWCPGECIFCPNDVTMPKSYINTEPGAQRALMNNFDPYKQVFNRLLSLTLTGHETDKIEMIVLGGTRDVYPQEYKTSFIKGLYDACNAFEQFFDLYISGQIGANTNNIDLDTLPISFPKTIAESITANETTGCRIIGLTLETRPEYVTDENCQYRRELGVTRIEMGVQTMFDDVLDANKRGHNIQQCRDAMTKLRSYGFKISIHLMPGLYKSTIEKDIETFRLTFQDPAFCPDEIKFYPTAVIPNTELFELYKRGEYTPLTLEENKHIIKTVLTNYIPPYTRIKRLIRDIPAEETVGSNYVTNLRQLVENELMEEAKGRKSEKAEKHYQGLYGDLMYTKNQDDLFAQIKTLLHSSVIASEAKQSIESAQNITTFVPAGTTLDLHNTRAFVCLDTRSREIRNNLKSQTVHTMVRCYHTTNGLQCFISFEDELGYLYGFTRLQLGAPEQERDYPGLGQKTALIRELHVYGQLASIGSIGGEKTQHQGIGSQLMELAEQIAAHCGYTKASVISGVGVKKYYEKIGYTHEGTYMTKSL
ncbi:MAG: radical SAM protein [Candidatus Absconditabacterales bacterium]